MPISSVLLKKLEAHGLSQTYLFEDWWQGGDAKEKCRVGHMLSHRFAKRFEQAGCPDLRTDFVTLRTKTPVLGEYCRTDFKRCCVSVP